MKQTDPAASASWMGRSGLFPLVTGHDEAVDLLTDARLQTDFVALFRGTDLAEGTLGEILRASLLNLNGEEHKRFRSAVASAFTPRAVERFRHLANEAAVRIVDDIDGRSCEFVEAFAQPYVSAAICAFVGFPPEDEPTLMEAVDKVAVGLPDLRRNSDLCRQGLTTLFDYGRWILAERRAHPKDDVLSMIAAEVERGALTEAVAIALVGTLLSAGHEPTINQLAIMVSVLSERPDVWNGVDSGELSPQPVVEEVLRIRSTNRAVIRSVSEAFCYREVDFSQGHMVLIGLHEGNHDDRRFFEPQSFDASGDRKSHLAFGFGAHHCLGAALARVQLQEALVALSSRWECPRALDMKEKTGGGLSGLDSLEVTVDRRDRLSRPAGSDGR